MITVAADHHKREPLMSNWRVCMTPAGGLAQAPPESANWISLRRLVPAAAALRENALWSLDGPPVQFDAQDWWYKVLFDAPGMLPGQRNVLGFDGLATLVQVWLNGAPVLSSSNMFVGHECDVNATLMREDNELLVHFCALDVPLATRRMRPRWRAPMLAHQQLRWHRTTLLGRTPGWSPPVAVVGPWKDVWLEHRGAVEVIRLHVETVVDGATGIVKCQLALAACNGHEIETVWLELERNGRLYRQRLSDAGVGGLHEGEMCLPEVALWWPHTHGESALYNLALRVRMVGSIAEPVVARGRVGFRTITLDTADGDFVLHVNGIEVFCRGACWTPLDAASLRTSPESCLAAVAQARAAGMNMLRVTGSMVYEEDHFYDACDEHGVLVWQDFMFSNMDYPEGDEAFVESVLLEVRQQVTRLRSSACIALFCGNSEVEQQAAMWGAPAALWQPALFNETLARICAELAPGTPYWPSSAHGGAFPHQASAGTTSYYGVGAYLRPLEDARRSNLIFATECLAFANVPGRAALENVPGGLATKVHHAAWKERSPRDLGAGWDFDDVRDHYLGLVFNADPHQLRRSDHEHYLTLSRMVTGEVMAASFSEWRRPGSSCRGAMVWFLRDLWAGAGWGVIDDAGRPKACYFYLKRVLQPLTVVLSDEGVNGLFVHVLNERPEGSQVDLELSAWRGDVQVAVGKKALVVQARGTQSLSGVELLGHFMDLTYAYRFGPMSCDAVVATLTDTQSGQITRAFHFPAGLSAARGASVGLSAKAVMTDAVTAELTIHTQRFAHGIYFDIPGFQPDDDYFHLPPGGEVRVTLHRSGEDMALAGAVHAANSMECTRVEWTKLKVSGPALGAMQ